MRLKLPKSKKLKFRFRFDRHIPIIIILLAIITSGYYVANNKVASLESMITSLTKEKDKNLAELEKIGKEIDELKNQDQVKKNEELQTQIGDMEDTYTNAIAVYESLIELRNKSKDTKDLETKFADALYKLSQRDASGAQDTLNQLAASIKQEEDKIAASFTIPESAPQNNTPPGSGYSRQSVNVEGLGTYLVSIVAADIGSTRIIVDTASDSDCGNDCPVLPLATYVSRNGAYAGVNGTYFCPASYPSCAGKTNTYDLLVMNYKKTYFNSDNNVYSGNPAVIFGDGYIRFVSSVSQWGRDTSPNGVISNFPLLVFNNQVVFGGDDDPKKGSKGGRSFVANKGNTAYIGVVHNATVAESARVLSTMGMENAMNLDDGGSTALWSGGYKVGPGRNLPNVVLFVSK
jgi:hypothetical protein